MKKNQFTLATLLAGSLLSFNANATLINITFSGTTQDTCTDCVAAGLAISATYTFDTDDVTYGFEGAIVSAEFTLDNSTYTISGNELFTVNEGEVLEFSADNGSIIEAQNQFYGEVNYFEVIENSEDIRWNPYDIAGEYSGDFTLTGSFFGNGSLTIDGVRAGFEATTFTVSTVSAVPVPAAVWLFSTGLIGLVGVARRKRA